MKPSRPRLVLAIGASLVIAAALFVAAPASTSAARIAHPSPQASLAYWDPSQYRLVAVSSAAPPQAVICDPTTANQCALVTVAGYLDVAVQNKPSFKIVDSSGSNTANVNPANELRVTGGGDSVWPAVGATPSNAYNACTVLSSPPPKRVATLVVESGAQQQAGTDLVLYDSTSTSGCTTANEFYHTGQMGAGGSFPVNWPVSSGVAYKFTGGTNWVGDGFRISGN